jgi:hypothetical protein
MAFLHCHSCGWSQDDFYDVGFSIQYCRWRKSWWKVRVNFGYNPLTKMWRDIKWWWKPRYIVMDNWYLNDILKFTKVKVKHQSVNRGQTKVFSLCWLLVELVKDWRVFRNMRWLTYNSWKRHGDTAVCPNCGDRNFDID